MIFTVVQYSAHCDVCYEMVVGVRGNDAVDYNDFVKQLREDGWKVGKETCLCPTCSHKKENNKPLKPHLQKPIDKGYVEERTH